MVSIKKLKFNTIAAALVAAMLVLASCGSDNQQDPTLEYGDDSPPPTITITFETAAPIPAPVFTPIDYDTVRPYEVGQIMVLMYHRITLGEAPTSWDRNIDDFKQDLQNLYDMGFRTISIRDYIANNITTAAGYTPVVITFDDGDPSAFSLKNENGQLVPAENTAVYIMEEFYRQNPDFGKHATFYINGGDPFAGDGTLAERFKWLIDNGYEIGNHTWSHPRLNEISDAEQLQSEIGRVDKLIRDNLPGYTPMGIAYPYGTHPIAELRPYMAEGEFEGHRYSYNFALHVGETQTRATAPNRVAFDPWMISRVRGSNDEQTDLGWKLFTEYAQYPEMRYISDGSPFRISVPSIYVHNIDEDSIGDKELWIYDLPE